MGKGQSNPLPAIYDYMKCPNSHDLLWKKTSREESVCNICTKKLTFSHFFCQMDDFRVCTQCRPFISSDTCPNYEKLKYSLEENFKCVLCECLSYHGRICSKCKFKVCNNCLKIELHPKMCPDGEFYEWTKNIKEGSICEYCKKEIIFGGFKCKCGVQICKDCGKIQLSPQKQESPGSPRINPSPLKLSPAKKISKSPKNFKCKKCKKLIGEQIFLFPCGHSLFCEQCLKSTSTKSGSFCPECNTNYAKYIRLPFVCKYCDNEDCLLSKCSFCNCILHGCRKQSCNKCFKHYCLDCKMNYLYQCNECNHYFCLDCKKCEHFTQKIGFGDSTDYRILIYKFDWPKEIENLSNFSFNNCLIIIQVCELNDYFKIGFKYEDLRPQMPDKNIYVKKVFSYLYTSMGEALIETKKDSSKQQGYEIIRKGDLISIKLNNKIVYFKRNNGEFKEIFKNIKTPVKLSIAFIGYKLKLQIKDFKLF